MAELLRDGRNLVSERARVSLGRGWPARLKQYVHFKHVFDKKEIWLVVLKNVVCPVRFIWKTSI